MERRAVEAGGQGGKEALSSVVIAAVTSKSSEELWSSNWDRSWE